MFNWIKKYVSVKAAVTTAATGGLILALSFVFPSCPNSPVVDITVGPGAGVEGAAGNGAGGSDGASVVPEQPVEDVLPSVEE